MRAKKPSSKTKSFVRCDGKKYEYKPIWKWSQDSCDECGQDLKTGHWYESNTPEFHLGSPDPPITTLNYGEGSKYTCCGEKISSWKEFLEQDASFFKALMPSANAVIKDLKDPVLTDE